MPLLPLLLLACGPASDWFGGGDPLSAADRALAAGDFAGAGQAWEAALQADPADADAAIGLAYVRLLAGDEAEADRLLAAAAATAPERAGDIALRRALVAQRRGDLDAVEAHGVQSGSAAGRLLAAEVALVDGDHARARARLDVARGDPGGVGETARAYLALLDAPRGAGVAEVQALWALGERRLAVRSAPAALRAWAEGRDDAAEAWLVWAGRAAVVGEGSLARQLTAQVPAPPAGQAWRVPVTLALADCGEGRVEACRSGLAAVTDAPPEALADARVTAADLVAAVDPAAAAALLDGLTGDAAARARAALGDAGAATLAADPVLRAVLGG